MDKEFVGGCDILMQMHKDGSLAEMLSKGKLIIEEEGSDVEGQGAAETRETTEQSTGANSKDSKGESSDTEGQGTAETRATTEQSTGANSKDSKGESS